MHEQESDLAREKKPKQWFYNNIQKEGNVDIH